MTDVTQILWQIEQGDPSAADQLLPLVFEELRKLAAARFANEKPGQTLQATALVHDAYIRLVDVEKVYHWNSRRHFFAAAAEAMRRILVENARRKQRGKHGGALLRHDAAQVELAGSDPPDAAEVLAVHDALKRLHQKSPRKAELVKLRYFLGYTLTESAEILGIATATAEGDWTYAKAWLRRELRQGEEQNS